MGVVAHPRQKRLQSSKPEGTIELAEVLAALKRDCGYNPRNNYHYKLLSRRTGLRSEATIRFILNGQTTRPHPRTLEKLVNHLCPDRPGSAELLRIAAKRPPHHTPPE